MRMNLLEPDENPEVFYHSSITQHKNKLSVYKGGEWLPISYDVIDYIDCKRVVSHRAIVTDKPDIGYEFPVNEWHMVSDTYLTGDFTGTKQVKLDPWFGEGYYEKYVKERVYLNAKCSSLGIRNEDKYRVGLNYALAKRTLKAED